MATFGKLLRPQREIMERVLAALGDKPLTDAQVDEARGYDFGKVIASLDGLRPALEQAIETDKAEATSFWNEISQAAQKGLLYIPAFLRFRDEADALIARAWSALDTVETMVRQDLGLHAHVPEQLDADTQRWTANSQSAMAVEMACAGLADLPDWVGDARNEYARAALVQQKAMSELAGIMASTAQGCHAGALLNRAIFLVVSEAIADAVMEIQGAHGGGSNRSRERFSRTAAAIGALEHLADKVGRAIDGAVAEGSARNLSSELQNTMTMPRLLAPGAWPTGTEAADIEPADTGAGVTVDGSDANSRVVASRKGTTGGIDR